MWGQIHAFLFISTSKIEMSLGGAYQFFIFSLMWCLDGACNITFPIPPPIYLEPQDSASTHFGKDLIVRNRNEYKEMLLQEMFMIPKKT